MTAPDPTANEEQARQKITEWVGTAVHDAMTKYHSDQQAAQQKKEDEIAAQRAATGPVAIIKSILGF